MPTTTETITVDGVDLNTYAINVSTLAGRLRTPAVRGNNLTIPGRHGQLRTKQKFFQDNVITLPMWVRGTNATTGASPSRSTFFTNIDALTSLFGNRNGLLDVRHTLADGSVRQCFAEVLEVLDFSTAGSWGNPSADFTVALTIPSGFWQSVSTVTQTFTSPTRPSTLSLTSFAGVTAPMDDLTFTITGPITNPEIHAYENSAALEVPIWFKYTGVIAASTSLIVNCNNWTVTGTGFTPTYNLLTHTGSSRFMSVLPAPSAGSPQIRLEGSAGSPASVAVSGYKKFLVG
jgi:hypothetical protein